MWIWNEGLVMWYKIAQSQKTIDEMRKKFEQAFPNNKPGSFSKMNFPQMNFQKGTGAFGTQQTPGIKTQLQTRPSFDNEFIAENPVTEEAAEQATPSGQLTFNTQQDPSTEINIDDSVSAPPTARTPLEVPGVKDPRTNKALVLNPQGNKFWSIQPGTITSKFGPRSAPTAGASTFHQGIDIAGAEGTPILAAADGVVSVASSNKTSGNYIILDHGNGYQTSYSHLSAINIGVGKFVKKSQTIGKMGQTGIATGPHLHFMVYKNSVPINPL